MRSQQRHPAGFSLVEVTLAMGVAGFCLLAVFALLPIGVKTNQTAFSQTAAATILSDVVADMRAADKSAGTSPQFGINFNSTSAQHFFFDSEGRFATALQATSRYRLVVTIFPPVLSGLNQHYATYANVRVAWPAAVDPTLATAAPAGSIETVAAFERH
jgi:uncharacterized protein (TIGR02598 family)